MSVADNEIYQCVLKAVHPKNIFATASVILAAVCVSAVLGLVRKMREASKMHNLFHRSTHAFKKPLIPGQKKDVVYMFSLGDFYERPNSSPFCMKLETFLKLHKIPYELVVPKTSPISGPANKWPWIVYNDDVVTDTSVIITYLEKKVQYNV